ncbi:MAG: glycosyltransferase [Candidatus Omnitrophota bacterium]
MKVDILVLNYNGKDLMKEYLPSICEAAGSSSFACAVHVVDNLSTDGSVDFLRENFPGVQVHVAGENRILCSYNGVVRTLDSDIVIFLNNDMKVAPDFVDPLVKHFKWADTMFVAPRVMNFDGTFNGGRSYLKFDKGVIKVIVDVENFRNPGETCAISCGAFKRKTFLELGGFDDLYLPGIWEDVDICFAGLVHGLKGVYEPESVTWHAESTTFHKEYGRSRKMMIAHRNMFLFFWKNVRSTGLFLKHLVFLPPRILYSLFSGKNEFARGFFLALGKLPAAFSRRKRGRGQWASRKVKEKDLIH